MQQVLKLSAGVKAVAAMAATLCAALGAALCSTPAQACGSREVQDAVRLQTASSRFSAAARLCAQPDDDAPLSDLPHVPVRSRAPQDGARDEPTVLMPGDGAPTISLTPLPPVVPAMVGVGRDAARRAMALAPQIDEVAEAYRIDPLLLHAIAHVESRHNPGAISHAGARGLMQVMPQTGRRFGVASPGALLDPQVSLEVSAAYLKTLQARFGNDLPIVIAAYNAGEGAVEKYGRAIPPYAETRRYVQRVMAHYRLLLGVRSAHLARGGR